MFKRIKEWLAGEKIVYKVIWHDRRSCIVEGRATVNYCPKVWARPPNWLYGQGYWLTCFETLRQAKRFKAELGKSSWSEIWQCCAKGIKKELPPICAIGPLDYGQLYRPTDTNWDWPEGTIMARELKLVRRVA